MDWTVAMPAWGRRCVDLAVNVAIPSVRAAAAHAGRDVRIIVHTDEPHAFSGVELRPIASDAEFEALTVCHREVMREATGSLAFVNADNIVSREAFVASEARFAEGKRVVLCASPRTCGGVLPDAGVSGPELLEFASQWPHLITRDSTFPRGVVAWPSVMYLRDGDNWVMHGFHLHPFALLAADYEFTGSIDGDLCACMTREDIHVVTDPAEMAMIEISPLGRTLGRMGSANRTDHIASWAAGYTMPMHRWLFGHRIVLRGDGDALPWAPVREIQKMAEVL